MIWKGAVGRLCIALLLCLVSSLQLAKAQVSQQLSRRIIGKNFLGVEEVAEHLGIGLTGKERARVRDIPYSEATLQQCKDSHILFLGVGRDKEGKPLTIRCLREMFPAGGQPCFRSYPRGSETEQAYSDKETPHLRWYLIARSLREESRSKPYWQQHLFLKENEYREKAVVYVYMMLLMYKARGERLFERDLVLCRDVGSDGAPVIAGYFAREGIYVRDWWHRRDNHFGVAPARKRDFPCRRRAVERN